VNGTIRPVRAGLQQILDLERIEDLVFRGRSREGVTETRVFGGEVAGQALVAAARTVEPDRTVHSLHAYFLRPGDPTRPILYQVGIQHGDAIFTLSASFQVHEDGLHHQLPVLDATPPEDLPPATETVPGRSEDWFARFPIELRFPDGLPWQSRDGDVPPRQLTWMRSPERLADDPALHACAVTYFSDLMLLSTALLPHRRVLGDPRLQMASLDHAVWFHAPFRADDWLCYQQEGTWAGNARALCRGYLFDRHGTLVATVMQEGLIRLRDPR
jgi:acyl-CoA thioesterase-2